ncbi:hypothetical protein HYPSUDRAFT_37672 [Hypholoma sublateritium FD-334 SS-4]|uniref:Uncharacterized protein n=1 Tax=Hypholoma sublateritium (strain FD-334 SS-4) TaxID=945553 RepID=A0A0D2Q275_HYPSF|nr:hypothetical protein HYPSUDRAFT_37672 [Hypholoma sublateritium FD-334 SS-4]
MEALPPSPPPSPPPSTGHHSPPGLQPDQRPLNQPPHNEYSQNQPFYNPRQAPFPPAPSTQHSLSTTPFQSYPDPPANYGMSQVHYTQSQFWAQGYVSGCPPMGPAHFGSASSESPPNWVPYYPQWGPGCPEGYPPYLVYEPLDVQSYHQPLLPSPPYRAPSHTADPAYTSAGAALQPQPQDTQPPPSLQPSSLARGAPTAGEIFAFNNRLQANLERFADECEERLALNDRRINFLVHSVIRMKRDLEDIITHREDIRTDFEDARARFEDVRTQVTGHQRELTEREAELEDLRTDTKTLASQVDSLQHAHSVDKDMLHDVDNKLALLKVGLRRRYPDFPY